MGGRRVALRSLTLILEEGCWMSESAILRCVEEGAHRIVSSSVRGGEGLKKERKLKSAQETQHTLSSLAFIS